MKKEKKKNYLKFLLLNRKELEFFIDNLAVLISSGMTILDAIKAIRFEIKTKFLQKIIDQIIEDLDSGLSLSSALENSDLFQERTLFLLKIGEQSGRLAQNLKIINEQQTKERELSSKLTSALIYPGIIMVLTVVIALLLGLFVLPRLSTVYNSLRVELPPITKFLVSVGTFMGEYGTIFVPAVIIFLVGTYFLLFINKKTKKSGQFLLFHFSVTKSIVTEIEISRMGFILGTLIQAGVPLVDSIRLLQKSSDFYVYSELYEYLLEKIEDGFSFEQAFKSYKKIENLLPPSVTQLIVTGEQSGTLSDLLIRISKTYEAKNELSTKNLSVIIEPVLLIVVWIGVAFIALSIILPIYSLIGNINDATNQGGAQPATATSSEEEIVPTIIQTPTVTSTIAIEPTTTTTPSPTPITKLRINSTAGFLNVREKAASSSKIVGKVNDKEEYVYTTVQSGWYQITLTDGTVGWVSGQFITKI